MQLYPYKGEDPKATVACHCIYGHIVLHPSRCIPVILGGLQAQSSTPLLLARASKLHPKLPNTHYNLPKRRAPRPPLQVVALKRVRTRRGPTPPLAHSAASEPLLAHTCHASSPATSTRKGLKDLLASKRINSKGASV